MKLLLVAATGFEIAPFITQLEQNAVRITEHTFRIQGTEIHVLLTGVGIMATTYALTKKLLQVRFDAALQVGVGGSYDRHVPLGSVVQITSEVVADLGAEDHYQFLDIYQLGLLRPDDFPFRNGRLNCLPHALFQGVSLPEMTGATVNMVSGSSFTADLRINHFGCQVESMEGAAFHYVCLQEQVPFLQVRAISNYVEPRNRDAWQMPLAIKNLNNWLFDFFQLGNR